LLEKWSYEYHVLNQPTVDDKVYDQTFQELKDLEETLAKEKSIFIFDEADNSLDENNKKAFYQRLEKLSKERIIILVSH